MSDDHKLEPGQKVNLSEIEADGKVLHDDRKEAEKEFKELRKEFRELQARLYAEDKRQMLIVFGTEFHSNQRPRLAHHLRRATPLPVPLRLFPPLPPRPLEKST